MSAAVPIGLPDTERWLADRIAEGQLFTGAQLAVVHEGRQVVDVALGTDGLARPVLPSTAFRIYCAAKPLLATAVCAAVDAGRVRRGAALAGFPLDVSARVGEVTVDQLLHHQTPFTRPTGFGSAFIPSGSRARAVRGACEEALRAGWAVGYGEVANWLLLGEVLSWCTGRSWQALVADQARAADAPIEELCTTPDELVAAHRDGRIGVNVSRRDGRLLPLLGEVEPSLSERLDGPGFGAAASSRFLARFLHHGVVRRGHAAVRSAQRVAADATFGRDLWFADGCMVGPASLGLDDLWPEDVAGHVGIGGMTLGFASPSLDLSVAIHLNGLMAPTDGADHVRPALTGLLHAELLPQLAGPV